MTDTPPPSSAARAGRIALAVVFAVPIFLWRSVRKLWLVVRAELARRGIRARCRKLGARMEVVNIGDEYIREKIATARRALSDDSQKDQRSKHAADLDRGLLSLGTSGAAAGVPVMGAEAEYRRYHAAVEHADALARSAATASVFPPTLEGWLALAGGVGLTVLVVYLVGVL